MPSTPSVPNGKQGTDTNLPVVQVTQDGELQVYELPTEFVTVDRGSGTIVNFMHHGDSFTGILEDFEQVTTEEGEVLQMATLTGADNQPYAIFPNRTLLRGMSKVPLGYWVRITYIGDIDTGKPTPMKTYTVERGPHAHDIVSAKTGAALSPHVKAGHYIEAADEPF